MAYLHQRQGRFLTVLPRTRGEDTAFRELLAKGQVTWRSVWEKTDEEGVMLDRFSISDQPATTAEGHPLREEGGHAVRPGYRTDDTGVAADATSDGVFPLVQAFRQHPIITLVNSPGMAPTAVS
jgi:hypothetical protein